MSDVNMRDVKIIGHRGSGMNRTCNTLQLGENTLASFNLAHKNGAGYVEFDIQLTRDGIPVVFHDWHISASSPLQISQLSLPQFLALHPPSHPATGNISNVIIGEGHLDDECMSGKAMRIFKNGNMTVTVGNGHGSIQHPFTTLQEILTKLDQTLGFNIEIKYVCCA